MKMQRSNKSTAKGYGIRKFAVILPLFVALLWIASIGDLYRHGGFRGNVRYVDYGPSHSPVIDYSQKLPVLFNRWMVDPHDESGLELALGYVCWPGFKIANWITAGLSEWVPEFRKFAPYGLTFDSYHFMLAMMVSLFLWGVVGYVRDILYLRRRAVYEQE